MWCPFNVVSKRSGKVRQVWAVSTESSPRFLIYRDGEWIWEDSKWYMPIMQANYVASESVNNIVNNDLFVHRLQEVDT